jgi:hypothetical protein
MSALSDGATCLTNTKRGHAPALHIKNYELFACFYFWNFARASKCFVIIHRKV